MIESKLLSSEDRSFVYIEKGQDGVLIGIYNTHCIVVSTTQKVSENIPFIPYVYSGNTSTDTYETFLHLIGKMALKDSSSKYFSAPVWTEHCKNGHPRGTRRESWEQEAAQLLAKYRASIQLTDPMCIPHNGRDLDRMTPAEVKAYVDSVDFSTLRLLLDNCSFACIKRTYEKYYGFLPVSTQARERVILQFQQTKRDRSRTAALLGPCC